MARERELGQKSWVLTYNKSTLVIHYDPSVIKANTHLSD